eukprot:315912_1
MSLISGAVNIDQYLTFKVVTFELISEWTIDITNISETDKNILQLCHRLMHEKLVKLRGIQYSDQRCIKAEKYVIQLLQNDVDKGEYNFLYALCSDEMARRCKIYERTYYRKNWNQREATFSYNSEYYSTQADFYFSKSIQIEPNNPIYILQYAYWLSKNRHLFRSFIQKAFNYFERFKLLFDCNTSTHIDSHIMMTGYAIYLSKIILRNYYKEHETVLKKLHELNTSFQEVLQYTPQIPLKTIVTRDWLIHN